MATQPKQTKEQTLASIDAALTILNRFPNLEDSNVSLSFNTSNNPFEFIMDILKRIIGFDKLLQIIAKFITFGLPPVEVSVKAMLIAKLKDIISCSVNPFLTKEILDNGITFNIEEIDLVDILKYSPFDKKIGYLYYYQNEETYKDKWKNKSNINQANLPKTPDDCIYSDDMNCLLWFMINRANKRYVWKPKKNRHDPEFREDYPDTAKLKKEDGIVTFEFTEKSANLKDAYGNKFYVQSPFNNILHVFIGDVRQWNTAEEDNWLFQLNQKEIDVIDSNNEIKIQQSEINAKVREIEEIDNAIREYDAKLMQNEITQAEHKQNVESLYKKKKELQSDIEDLENGKQNILSEIKEKTQFEISKLKQQIIDQAAEYIPFGDNRNYYYGKTLIEFNVDYITSLSLFNSTSLVATLLDSITGLLTVDLNLSYRQQIVRNEVIKMVKMITETDDIVVSDCFFTFSNDDYDAMSRKAELRKAGLFTINGDETSAVKIDPQTILSTLNELNTNTDLEKKTEIIENSLKTISAELSNTEAKIDSKVNFNVQMNFIENVLNNLGYALVMSVLSPKVYLLLLINLKIIGRETNFNLEGFIGQYKQLIADIVRSVRDELLRFLREELRALIDDLANQIIDKLGIEQARYYIRLIKKLTDCFKRRRRGNEEIDWDMDNVDYADILPTEEEPKNSNC